MEPQPSASKDDVMPPERRRKYAIISALFFMSPVMAADLVLELLCVRFPLVMYLVLGAVGAGAGWALASRLAGGGRLKKALRAVALLGATGTLLGNPVCLGTQGKAEEGRPKEGLPRAAREYK